MKYKINNALKHIPGYRSQKNCKIATIYYGVLIAMIIVPLVLGSEINVGMVVFTVIAMVVPFLVVGIKNFNKSSKIDKLIYIVYPLIFIIASGYVLNLNSKSSYNAENKAINNLGITYDEYTNTVKIYSNVKAELMQNKSTNQSNEPVVTAEYGYVASGNKYIHKTSNCKFIKDKAADKVSVSLSEKYKCNCWHY